MAYKLCLGNPLSKLSSQDEWTLVINKNTSLFCNGCKTPCILSTSSLNGPKIPATSCHKNTIILENKILCKNWNEDHLFLLIQSTNCHLPVTSHTWRSSCTLVYPFIDSQSTNTLDENISHATCDINNKLTWNVWHNQHKAIYDMIHVDKTHACIYLQWTYHNFSIYTYKISCICTLFNSLFQVQIST